MPPEIIGETHGGCKLLFFKYPDRNEEIARV